MTGGVCEYHYSIPDIMQSDNNGAFGAFRTQDHYLEIKPREWVYTFLFQAKPEYKITLQSN